MDTNETDFVSIRVIRGKKEENMGLLLAKG